MKPNRVLLAAAVLVLLLAGAGVATAQQQQQGILRAVHAAPGAPAVDVFVDGNRVFANVDYKTVTDYAVLAAGGHRVVVVPAGASPDQPLVEAGVNVAANSYNTVVVLGQPNSLRPLALVNDSTLPPLSQSKVRVVHASPNAPPVDVAVRGGAVLFNGVAYTQATPYNVVPAQTYNLEVRQAGTSNVVLDVPDVALNDAAVYTIYAVGLLNGQPGLEAIVAVDAPPLAACQTLVGGQAAATAQPTATVQATGSPTTAATTTGTPTAGTPTAGTPTAGTPTVGTPTTSTPAGSVTPQATVSPTGGTPQSASAVNPAGHAPVGALVQVGLSLAAVLGGMALSRRLF